MKFKGSFALLFFSALVLFFSCTKINEATTLGSDLIPVVDNVNTFDTTLEVSAAYFPHDDTTRHGRFDNFAIGRLNDPDFGTTTADAYFNFSSPAPYGSNPFVHKDSVKAIDSVVLSLGYQGAYGDTSTAQISVEVSEILSGNGVKDDSIYRYDFAGFATGPVLGRRTFSLREVKDSFRVVRKGDTSKVANTLRIRFDNVLLAQRLRDFDTSAGKPNPGFSSDSAFRALFRGLAVKTTAASGVGALGYFNLANPDTKLIVYYKAGKSTGIDSGASVAFTPLRSSSSRNLSANSIGRTPSAAYANNLGKTNSQLLYLQTSPVGSYIGINVPGLATFPNRIIHRAELIAYAVPTANDLTLTKQNLLFLAHNNANRDSVYLFERDLVPGLSGSLDYGTFGGVLRSDQSYRYNITRYVQGIVTRKERNDSLRIYTPLFAYTYANTVRVPPIPVLNAPARGRVIIANNNYPDSNRRLRLRIIYSNL